MNRRPHSDVIARAMSPLTPIATSPTPASSASCVAARRSITLTGGIGFGGALAVHICATRSADPNLATAARAAVARFGSAERVAQMWTASAPPKPMPPVKVMLRRAATQLALLAGVGLVAIGVSGLIARAMTSLWGLRFMFADPPGTTYQ